MNLNRRVKCDQSSAALTRQCNQPGVVHLLMPQSPLIEPRIGGRRRFPKLMARMLTIPMQQGCRSAGTYGLDGIGEICGQPDECHLRQGASSPPVPGFSAKPAVRGRMVLMVGPGESEQNVDIQQSRLHLVSLSSSSAARDAGMIGASRRTGNTGSPPWCAKPRLSPFNACRTKFDNTCPSLLPEVLARLCTA
jgi:hypothetical protein